MNKFKKANNLLHSKRLNLMFSVTIERIDTSDYYNINRRKIDGEIVSYGTGWITKNSKGYTLEWADCFNKIRKTYLPPSEFDFEF
ncbi:MAG: hypothetical protein [Circular genetic element sp.]|nr:MAG: hypothetical protein [Circular genetic element sp.]